MELYSFTTYLLVFVAATVMLCALALPPIYWHTIPWLRRKSFWKSVDYCWIILAVLSLWILVNSLTTKNHELRVAELNSEVEAIKGLQAYQYSELMNSPSELGGKNTLCSDNEGQVDYADTLGPQMVERDNLKRALAQVRRNRGAETVFQSKKQFQVCPWLHFTKQSLALTWASLLSDKSKEARELLDGQLRFIYLLAELHPLATKPPEEILALVDGDLTEHFQRDRIRRLLDHARCDEISIEKWPYNQGAGARQFYYYTLGYCTLAIRIFHQKLAIDDLGNGREWPWLFQIGWPFMLAFGLAIRVTRTTAEALIDYLDGK